jgi:hypothetical protein
MLHHGASHQKSTNGRTKLFRGFISEPVAEFHMERRAS